MLRSGIAALESTLPAEVDSGFLSGPGKRHHAGFLVCWRPRWTRDRQVDRNLKVVIAGSRPGRGFAPLHEKRVSCPCAGPWWRLLFSGMLVPEKTPRRCATPPRPESAISPCEFRRFPTRRATGPGPDLIARENFPNLAGFFILGIVFFQIVLMLISVAGDG